MMYCTIHMYGGIILSLHHTIHTEIIIIHNIILRPSIFTIFVLEFCGEFVEDQNRRGGFVLALQKIGCIGVLLLATTII